MTRGVWYMKPNLYLFKQKGKQKPRRLGGVLCVG